MTEPAFLNLSIYQGADWSLTLGWYPGGTFLDLTGWSGALKIRQVDSNANYTFTTATTTVGTYTAADGTPYNIKSSITAAATKVMLATFENGSLWPFDLTVVDTLGVVYPIARGSVAIYPLVSR